MNVSRVTVIKIYKLLRNIFVLKMNSLNQKIAWENHIVQVDESVLNKRRCYKVLVVHQKWVIGMIYLITKYEIIK